MDPIDDDNDDSADRLTARLRRPAWPARPLSFAHVEGPSAAPGAAGTADSPLTIHAAIDGGLVRADRFTCALSPERWRAFATHRSGSKPALVVIHALDAAASTPLLLYWLFENLTAIAELRRAIVDELGTRVIVALPDDLPSPWRKMATTLGAVQWISPRYPAGSWRLMPHVLRSPIDRTLVLDAIAAVDLAEVHQTHAAVMTRPIALEAEAGGVPTLLRVHRGASLAEVAANIGLLDHERWASGPPLAVHPATDDMSIGDGELCFYREPRLSPLASACVRCGECIDICPTRCDPVELLDAAAHLGRRAARRAGIASCIDCGLCTHACPSAIPLHSVIASLRLALTTSAAEVPR